MAAMRYWQDMTSPDLAAFAESDGVVLLPLAAVEQHGQHLPLSTDLDINLGLLMQTAAELPDDFPWLVLPPVSVGTSVEHAAFSGTLSLQPETLIQVLVQAGRAVCACGLRRLVLFNTHGGNRAVADIAALRLRHELGMLVVKAHYFDFPLPDDVDIPAQELRHGLHGGQVETSLMLHLKPSAVRMQHAVDARSLGHALEARNRRLGPQGVGAFAWMAGDLHPLGAVGNAAAASVALGETLARHYARVLAELLQEVRAFRLSDLRP